MLAGCVLVAFGCFGLLLVAFGCVWLLLVAFGWFVEYVVEYVVEYSWAVCSGIVADE